MFLLADQNMVELYLVKKVPKEALSVLLSKLGQAKLTRYGDAFMEVIRREG